MIFEDKYRSLLVKSGDMEKGSKEFDIFSEIVSTIKLDQ